MPVNKEGGGEIYKKTPILLNHVLHWHTNEFNSFLEFLELRKTSYPDNTSDLSMDDGSIKRREADKIIVGRRLSDYLLPCHPYGDNNPKQG